MIEDTAEIVMHVLVDRIQIIRLVHGQGKNTALSAGRKTGIFIAVHRLSSIHPNCFMVTLRPQG
jgi:hypothetical protein